MPTSFLDIVNAGLNAGTAALLALAAQELRVAKAERREIAEQLALRDQGRTRRWND